MIEIAISSELAAEHPRFMAGCAERGHQVEVFASSASERVEPALDGNDTVDTQSSPEHEPANGR